MLIKLFPNNCCDALKNNDLFTTISIRLVSYQKCILWVHANVSSQIEKNRFHHPFILRLVWIIISLYILWHEDHLGVSTIVWDFTRWGQGGVVLWPIANFSGQVFLNQDSIPFSTSNAYIVNLPANRPSQHSTSDDSKRHPNYKTSPTP